MSEPVPHNVQRHAAFEPAGPALRARDAHASSSRQLAVRANRLVHAARDPQTNGSEPEI